MCLDKTGMAGKSSLSMMPSLGRGEPTSIPITTTDLKLCCCRSAWSSGVTIEKIDFSIVPRCSCPRLARSTSGTVLPKANTTEGRPQQEDGLTGVCYAPREFCSVTMTGTPTTCTTCLVPTLVTISLHACLRHLDHLVHRGHNCIEVMHRRSLQTRSTSMYGANCEIGQEIRTKSRLEIANQENRPLRYDFDR